MLAISNLELSGWICFVLGALTFVVGLGVGSMGDVKEILKIGSSTRGDVETKVASVSGNVSDLTTKAVGAAKTEGTDPDVATAAAEAGAAAKDALKDIAGLLNALAERLRFAGFLMLVGAFVMSVGTVQFGGTSIF